MPFTYSTAYGLTAGTTTYMVLNTAVWIIEKLSGGRIKPANKEEKGPWMYKIPGLLPPWVMKAARGKKDFGAKTRRALAWMQIGRRNFLQWTG